MKFDFDKTLYATYFKQEVVPVTSVATCNDMADKATSSLGQAAHAAFIGDRRPGATTEAVLHEM
jgi:hypothetical protein